MAIALRAAGATNAGANNFACTIPAAQVTGDMMILVVTGKPFDAGWSVATAGWTALSRGQSGTTAAGVDTGSMATQIFYKEATSDTETNPTVTEGSPVFNIVAGVVYVFSKGAGEIWATPVDVYGGDEVTGTAIAVTFGSDPGGAAGDYVMLACGINTDSMGPLTTALTPTWTGITFGTADTAVDGETTLGGDISIHAISRPVSSGTSSAAPTATGTGTATGGADRLEAAFVRLRVSTAAVERAASLDAAADVASVPQRDVLRSVSIDPTAVIVGASQRDVLRATSVDALAEIVSAGIAVTGGATLERAASLDAIGDVVASAQRDVLRQASLDAIAGIASASQRDLLRQTTVDAIADIIAAGGVVGGPATLERAASLDAVADVVSAIQRDVFRQVALDAIAVITAAGTIPPAFEIFITEGDADALSGLQGGANALAGIEGDSGLVSSIEGG